MKTISINLIVSVPDDFDKKDEAKLDSALADLFYDNDFTLLEVEEYKEI